MLNFAHRGFSARYPENTMLSFRRAVEAGCDGIELDVQLTKDGVPVVIHDETLDRTTDGKGLVCACTAAELKSYNAAKLFPQYGFQPIPTLEEYFAFAADMPILTNVELKNSYIRYEGMEEKVLSLIDKFSLREKTIISSFNHFSVLHMRELAGNMKYGFLEDSLVLDAAGYAGKYGVDFLHPLYQAVDEDYVQAARRMGIGINTYTVNDPDRVRWLRDHNIHGVIGNDPAMVRDILLETAKEGAHP